jgi:hypothetical protein
MSFIEVLVAAAIITLIFGGLIAGFQTAMALLADTRAQTGALALANERIEYLRSLPYDSVGTISGIPSGLVPQNETVVLNGTTYNRRTLVQYVDSTADGFGASDSNGITADYKRAKVEVSWSYKGVPKSLSLLTNLIPRGMETVAGGGTLIANIFDASAVPVSNAAVRVVNASTSPSIDVIAYTNALGQVIFPGAPAGGGYQISATKAGFSTAQTYSASTTNPNPNPPHVAVVEGEVSTVNFAIDRNSTTTILTVEPPSVYQDTDTFSDMSGIALSTSTTATGGALILSGVLGSYPSTGEALATATAPANLISWKEARFTSTVPSGTSALVRIYGIDGAGVRTMVPDTDIPGNSSGFTVGPIDLTSLNSATYPRLALGVSFTTVDASTTPEMNEWELEYEAANVPIPGIAVEVRGAKSIGTDTFGLPVTKYVTTRTTNAYGSTTVGPLEWDTYTIRVDGASTGYDIVDACPRLPVMLPPNTATTTTLVLRPSVTRPVRVYVQSVGGVTLEGAQVRLYRGGYDTTVPSSSCGSSFFSNPPNATDYTLETTATGYDTETLTNVAITGATDIVVTLTPS